LNQFKLIISAVFKDNASSRLRNLSRQAQKTTKSVDNMAGSFKNLAGAFTAMMVASYVRRGLGVLVRASQDMEMSMARLGALTQKARSDLIDLEAAAIKAAEVTIYGPTQAAGALTKLTQATGSAKVAMKTLTPTLDLAMASFGKLDPERTSRMVADMAKSFGMGAAELKASTDKTYAVTRALGVEIQSFEKIMGRMGQAAIIGGQSFDEMLIAMTMAARAAPSTLRASNQLLRTMSDLTTRGAYGMEQLGIKTRDAVTGKIEPVSKIMIALSQRWAQNQENVRDVLNATFGKGAVKPMLTAIAAMSKGIRDHEGTLRTGADAYNHLLKTARTSTGETRKAAERMMHTGEGMMMLMRQAGENLARTLGDALAPALKTIYVGVKAIADILRYLLSIPGAGYVMGLVIAAGLLRVGIMAAKAAFWGMKRILAITVHNVFQQTAAVGALTGAYRRLTGAAATAGVAMAGSSRVIPTPGGGLGRSILYTGPGRFRGISKVGGLKGSMLSMAAGAPKGGLMAGSIKAAGAASGMARLAGGAARARSALLAFAGGPVGMAIGALVLFASYIPDMIERFKKDMKKVTDVVVPLVKGLRNWAMMTQMIKGGARFGDIFAPGMGTRGKALWDLQVKIWDMEKDINRKKIEAAKQAYDWMLLGSERLEGLLGKLQGIAKQDFQVADVNLLNQMLTKIAGAKHWDPRYAGRLGALQKGALGMMPEMFRLMRKGAGPEGLLPKEHYALAEKATFIRQVVSELHGMGALNLGKKGLRQFTTGFLDPIRKAATGEYAKAESFKREMTEEGVHRAHLEAMSAEQLTRETLRDGFSGVVRELQGLRSDLGHPLGGEPGPAEPPRPGGRLLEEYMPREPGLWEGIIGGTSLTSAVKGQ
jgi:TP901 family phage tail tape measure protein